MASSGAESVRTAFYWPSAQRSGAAPPDLAHLDGVVLQAARRGLPVLPIVTGTPGWAASRAGDETSPAARPGALRGLPADAGRPLRAAGLAVGGAPRGRGAADPRLADLERAEPHPLLDAAARPGLRARLREAAARRPTARCARADPGARTILAGLPNESLDRAAAHLQGRRARAPSTRWRCTRTRASRATSSASPSTPGARCAASATAASRSGSPSCPGRRRRARRRTRPASRRPTAARRRRLGDGRAAARARPQAAADRAGLLVHVALARGLAELVRLLGPAARPRRARDLRAGAAAFRRGAPRLQGCAKAPRQRGALPLERVLGSSASTARAVRSQEKPGGAGEARRRAAARARRRRPSSAGSAVANAPPVAPPAAPRRRGLRQRAGGGRQHRACRPPSPPAPAARSPRSATGSANASAPA